MPQGDSYEKLGGVIAAMGRLERVFQGVIASSKKLKENIDKSDELFGTSNRLKNELTAAVTSPVLFKKLNEVLAKNLGGKATPEIRQNLAKAAALKKQYMASRKAQQKIDVQIAVAKARRPHVQSASALASLNRKIASLQSQSSTAGTNAFKQRWAMKAALARSQKAALSKNSKVGAISKFGVLSKAAGYAGIAVGAVVEGIKFFDEKIRESAQIVSKYSHFSVGGMHAAQLMYVKDIQRNIYASRALSGSMYDFAQANSDMKDSWKGINVTLDKLTLALGTVGSKLGTAVGKTLDPVAKAFDKFMGGLAKGDRVLEAIALAGGPATQALMAIAKGAGWKTEEEQMQETKERIKRRKAFFGGQGGKLQPGDVHPFEARMFGLGPARNPNVPMGRQGAAGGNKVQFQGDMGPPAIGFGKGGPIAPNLGPIQKKALDADKGAILGNLKIKIADTEQKIKFNNQAQDEANDRMAAARHRKAQLRPDDIQHKLQQEAIVEEQRKKAEEEWTKGERLRKDLERLKEEEKKLIPQLNIMWNTYDPDWTRPRKSGGADLMRV